MSEEPKEQISALMDGEVSADRRSRIVDSLLCEAQLIKVWERYNLISDVLRHNVCEAAIKRAQAARRASALHQGPLGAGTTEQYSSSYVAKRVAERIRHEPLPIERRRAIPLRPALGFALAASVAVVAVLGVQRLTQSPPGNAATRLHASVASGNELVAVRPVVEPEPASNALLASYLVNYTEFLDNGMRGLLPYARIATHHDATTP